MAEKIRVGVMGASGKMGREIIKAVLKDESLSLCCGVDLTNDGADCAELCELPPCGIKISTDLEKALSEGKPDVMVDFTVADAFLKNAPTVLGKGINLVVGTTGVADAELSKLGDIAREKNCGLFFTANFAIGAVLMMKFAAEAIKYMPSAEVIELHHDNKKDAPSGTAVMTLKKMAESRKSFRQGAENEIEKIEGSRGGDYEGMRVHSVRLPGFVAHQEVIFGGLGQTLTIKHDSTSRESFVPGVLLAVKKSREIKGLLTGLENIM